jgi:DNA-binding NtrC family response regulator
MGEFEAHPDIALVLTDVRMPCEMYGTALVKWIFANHPHVTVVIASGDVGRETTMRGLCGARAFSKSYWLDAPRRFRPANSDGIQP